MLETELIRARESGSARLLVVLHGLGDSLEGYRWLPALLDLPWLNCLLVNAPDPYYGGYAWYDFAGDPGPGIERSCALLDELLRGLPEQGFGARQTVLFGFSQGCLMVLETGLRHAPALAGLVGISGYLHDAEAVIREQSPAAAKTPVLLTHGTSDPLIPVSLVRKQAQALQQAGFQVEWHELDKAHTIAGEEELALVRQFLIRNLPGS